MKALVESGVPVCTIARRYRRVPPASGSLTGLLLPRASQSSPEPSSLQSLLLRPAGFCLVPASADCSLRSCCEAPITLDADGCQKSPRLHSRHWTVAQCLFSGTRKSCTCTPRPRSGHGCPWLRTPIKRKLDRQLRTARLTRRREYECNSYELRDLVRQGATGCDLVRLVATSTGDCAAACRCRRRSEAAGGRRRHDWSRKNVFDRSSMYVGDIDQCILNRRIAERSADALLALLCDSLRLTLSP